jgi:hypothetical protein
MKNQNNLMTKATRVARIFSNNQKDSEKHLYQQNKKPGYIKGIRLSFFFISNLRTKIIKRKQKKLSYAVKAPQTMVDKNTAQCCARQDFYVFPYKMVFCQKNFNYKKIVGWKISHNLEMIKNIKYFSDKITDNHTEFYRRSSISRLDLNQNSQTTHFSSYINQKGCSGELKVSEINHL